MLDIKNIRDQFVSKLKSELSLEEINSIKTELFGKNGQISSLFKTVGSIPEYQRKNFAADLNKIKENNSPLNLTKLKMNYKILFQKKLKN